MKAILMHRTAASAEASLLADKVYSVPGQCPEALAKELVRVGAASWTQTTPAETATAGGGGETTTMQRPWPLRMKPADYLKRYPKGKHAALAKELVS